MGRIDDWSIGDILWQDLTVSNVIQVRGFYQNIIGWDITCSWRECRSLTSVDDIYRG